MLPLLDLIACRRLDLDKRCQLFLRTHNEVLTIAVRVNDKDCSSLGIYG